MNIIDWIDANYPGNITEYDDRFEIAHLSGDHSTLFKNLSQKGGGVLTKLGDSYRKFDGMDLFSSTFKVSSIDAARSTEGVALVEPLSSLSSYASSLSSKFPEVVVPFMYQSGIGIYAIGIDSGRIYEWDEEQEELTGEYDSLDEIFQEWLDAIA